MGAGLGKSSMTIANHSDLVICHSDDDPELSEGEEEESVVDDALKKQIPRANSWRFGMTRGLAACSGDWAGAART